MNQDTLTSPLAEYDQLLLRARHSTVRKSTRAILLSTGRTVDALSLFGEMIKVPLQGCFPATTKKRLFFRGVLVELIWFLKGETNIRFLQENGVKIWDEWADSEGELGPVYGSQWRNWDGVDQVQNLITGLKKDPNGRRHIISAWNVPVIPYMKLPPCHVMSQWTVINGELCCMMTQRSADSFLGVPFNIASYALLTHIFARLLGLKPGMLTVSFGDFHIYANHTEAVDIYLGREEKPGPQLTINTPDEGMDLDEWLATDAWKQIKLEGYQHHPTIDVEIAV